jgi:hypothetical protein
MTVRYEFKLPGGDWTPGAVKWSTVYPHVRDHLRFHDGKGFKIGAGDGTWGPDRKLRRVRHPLHKRVDGAKLDDAVFVRSNKDDFTIGVRRHQMMDPVVAQMESWAKEQIGEGYVLGAAGPSVAYLLDKNGPGNTWRVIDAEPHDTGAPSGWFRTMLGTGIQLRPTLSGYYCELSEIVKVGRLYEVNGRP